MSPVYTSAWGCPRQTGSSSSPVCPVNGTRPSTALKAPLTLYMQTLYPLQLRLPKAVLQSQVQGEGTESTCVQVQRVRGQVGLAPSFSLTPNRVTFMLASTS